MSEIRLQVVDQMLKFTETPAIYSGDVNYDKVTFSFDKAWDECLVKTAVFYRSKTNAYYQVLTDNTCVIPKEVLNTKGTIYIGVFGSFGDTVITSQVISYRILEGTITEDLNIPDPTPDIYAQILAICNSKLGKTEKAESAKTADRVNWNNIESKPDTFPPAEHNHGDIYSPFDHNHDNTYASKNHNHDAKYLGKTEKASSATSADSAIADSEGNNIAETYAKKDEIPSILIFDNVSVTVNSWIEDNTYEDFPLKATVSLAGVTTDYAPTVTFNVVDSLSGVFAPVAKSVDGGVEIYASEVPTDNLNIVGVYCVKGVMS